MEIATAPASLRAPANTAGRPGKLRRRWKMWKVSPAGLALTHPNDCRELSSARSGAHFFPPRRCFLALPAAAPFILGAEMVLS